jgi:hypothetical protein
LTLSAVGWLAGWWLGMGVCTRRAGTRTRRDKPVLYESVTQFFMQFETLILSRQANHMI